MTLNDVLASWKSDPAVGPNIAAWKEIPERHPSLVDLPADLHPALLNYLKRKNLNRLYSHQAQAWDAINAGEHVVLSTGTASGKSLAYQLPVLQTLLDDQASRALLLFPTKALAHDQLDWLSGISGVASGSFDGDTPSNKRGKIRESASLIVSNPDMLHLGILPYHMQWAEFFQGLKFIVIDELHTYRGVFGSHVANVIRRLKRIAGHYGSFPRFILTSATIGNPQALAEKLVGEELVLIDSDGSARGKKDFIIYNPPIIDPALGFRASLQGEVVRLAADLVQAFQQIIIFGRSRRSVEFILQSLRELDITESAMLQSYRSGYLPGHRRELEAGLRNGSIRAVAATNALELGINIGGMHASLLAGYPGTIAAAWQQAGRSGRRLDPSLSLLVAGSGPLDQYLAQHPEYFFGANPEHGLINPDNLLIALQHLQCAVYELPFPEGSSFGSFSSDETRQLLEVLESQNLVHGSNQTYYWMADAYPAAEISLRNASPQQVKLKVSDQPSQSSLLGTVDLESAYWMVHPGAVYFHAGTSYLVDSLDLDRLEAHVSPFDGSYYTQADRQSSFEVVHIASQHDMSGSVLYEGELTGTSIVAGYKKINRNPYLVMERVSLDLPETILHTRGVWLALSENAEARLRDSGLWNSSPNEYGPEWQSIRQRILARDQSTCQSCGISGDKTSLHVHHRQPLRSFGNLQDANQSGNLISLCSRCHHRAEAVVKVSSGIRGLGHLLYSLAPLLLMCDPGDLGLHTDFQSPLGNGRPTILIYEEIPAGIGFSSSLYSRWEELLQKATDRVTKCLCKQGCPSCVGPGGEAGSGGKPETIALLKELGCSNAGN